MYNFYFKNIKKLMYIPIIVTILAVILLTSNLINNNELIQKDIELSGGKLLTIITPDSVSQSDFYNIDNVNVRISSGSVNTVLIEMDSERDEQEILDNIDITINEYSVKEVGPALGSLFWKQTKLALIFSFILMSVVVFILFRNLLPSCAVIFAAFSDITITLAILSLMNVQLSLAILAALLMLIGYSIDTDILLTSRLLKKKGDTKEKVKESIKTGLTMSTTALSALLVLYFLTSTLVIKQIAMVLLIGLIVDIPSTWLTNVGILLKSLGEKND